jgi:membrane protease YdiL (CAAX protease family)
VGAAAQLLQPGLGLAWTQLALFAFPAAALAARAGLGPRAFLRLVPPPPRTLGLALLIGVAAMLVGGALQALWSELLPAWLLSTFDVARLFQRAGWEQGLMIASAVGLAPVCEEVAFRGHLLSALRLRTGPAAAIALSALAFAAMHLDPVRFPGLLFLGLLYGWLTWRTGSVYPAVLAHAVNNAAATALALMGETGDTVAPLEPGAPAAALLVGLALLALPALALHRWLPTPPDAEAALAAGARPAGRLPGWAVALAWAAVISLSLIALAPRR